MASASEIREMFSAIAPQYDRLNRVLSCGVDRSWRKRVAAHLSPLEGKQILDLCCGTGDLSLLLAAHGAHVSGLDFAFPMLPLARAKAKARACSIAWTRGDAVHVPFASESFDAVTIAFGLRNVVAPEDSIRECCRVLRPGGTLAILEFFEIENAYFGAIFRAYFHHVLPRIARCFQAASSTAYSYLPQSVASFASPNEVRAWMTNAGLQSIADQSLSFGIARLLSGKLADNVS